VFCQVLFYGKILCLGFQHDIIQPICVIFWNRTLDVI